jgi:tetratricopeptide (TPR) repeat protein
LASINLLRGDIAFCGNPEFGEVKFSLSCDYSVQETFDLAISLLHSFEYDEAEKLFVKVIDADPDCAMAYWAIAMSRISPNWGPKREKFDDTRKLLKIAESLPKTSREKDYIDAMGAYYYSNWEKTDHRTRALKVEKKMEEIYLKYSDDTEAAIFYALILYTTTDPEDQKYTNQLKAGKILESIFPDQPNHPGIAHYIIHNYDNPELAPLALETARIYADIAPASAHAQHMPSHIFTRLGLWDESINTNLNSQSSSKCYAETVGLDHWHREVHTLGYLLYAYLQKGDNVRANDLYEYLKTIYKMPSDMDKIAYHFAAAPVRIALENKQWDKAMNVSVHPSTVQWNLFPWQKSLQSFARALGAAHTGDFKRAERELDSLQSFRQELLSMEDQYKANQVMIQIKAAQACLVGRKQSFSTPFLLSKASQAHA